VAAIDKRIANYDVAFLNCRRFRHFFQEEGIYRHTESRTQYIVIVNKCQTCAMERDDYFDRRGVFQFARRRYPDGYLINYTDKEKEEGVKLGTRAITSVVIRAATKSGLTPLRREE
jgi:hypothetical protein